MKLVERMVLLSSIEKADVALLLMPVAGGGGVGTCCMADSSSFHLGFILDLVRFLLLLFAPRPSSLRQTHLDLRRSALIPAWVVVASGFSAEKLHLLPHDNF